MRKRLLKFVFAVLVLLPVCANATTIKDFDANDAIQSGDSYDHVNIWNTAIVSMTGGSANSVWTYNSSVFQMENGNVPSVISAQNTSTIFISGGLIGSLQFLDYSVVYISGGNITGSLGIFGSMSTVHIYGKNFNCVPHHGGGWLITGNWNDVNNSPFSIWYRATYSAPMPGSSGSPIILHIPEPATVFLLGLGIALSRKKLYK